MEQGFIQTFVRGAQTRLIGWFTLNGLLLVGVGWIIHQYLTDDWLIIAGGMTAVALISAMFLGRLVGDIITKPTSYISQAILHISPSEQLVAAPNVDELRFGKELASNLTRHIYSYASAAHSDLTQPQTLPPGLLDQLPIAVIGINEEGVITLANSKALKTIRAESLAGQKLDDVLIFVSDDTISLKDWLVSTSEANLNDLNSWPKMEISAVKDAASLGYFDVAASFSKHSASGTETLIALYDHSDAYSDETASISFISLAVHELRTPVTILRGYIEAFEEELGPGLNPEAADYLKKMNASAEGVTSFITNILNVARINQNQLALNLGEGDWNTVLPEIVEELRNRAAVYGKQLTLTMQPGLPAAAIDRLTIGEVITNLVDNAIKYSPGNAEDIAITSKLNAEGLIETSVQDHGVGIPGSVMPNLFSKFSRNHRNKAQIGGTGLGLYLCKAIVTAHDGNIWVSSKENEGSTFSFTLVPFDQLAKELQTNNNEGIVRGSHGWIKNHSMQRR